jgi:type VI secretion system protein ImpJ
MKRLTRVVWSEGMYLGPLHFQAQSRYFESLLEFATGSTAFAPYGFASVQLDAEALRNGTAALVHARGIFPDGLVFHMPEHDPAPDPLPIADLFPPMHESVSLALAVPAQREDGLNCALEETDRYQDVRYRSEECELSDENTGRDPRRILLARKNIHFLLDTQSAEGLVTLAAARIRRDVAGRFAVDESFVPPILDINASPRLLTMLRRLIEEMEVKCRAIARPKDLGSPTASGFSAEGISNAWFLHCANSSLAPLRHLLLSKRPHPEGLYHEMARLAGALCTFGLESHPSNLPLYDHERLGDVFEALDRHIRAHLDLVIPSNRLDISLARVAAYFWEGAITDERVLGRSRWVFGIHSGVGEAELIERTLRLVKICSKQAIAKLVERALPGMKLAHLTVPPPAISPKVEYQYFSVDKAGPCWEHLMKTREIGIYIPGELPAPEIEMSVILEA